MSLLSLLLETALLLSVTSSLFPNLSALFLVPHCHPIILLASLTMVILVLCFIMALLVVDFSLFNFCTVSCPFSYLFLLGNPGNLLPYILFLLACLCNLTLILVK